MTYSWRAWTDTLGRHVAAVEEEADQEGNLIGRETLPVNGLLERVDNLLDDGDAERDNNSQGATATLLNGEGQQDHIPKDGVVDASRKCRLEQGCRRSDKERRQSLGQLNSRTMEKELP